MSFGLIYYTLGDAEFTIYNIFGRISTSVLAVWGAIFFLIWILHIVALIYDSRKANACNGEYDEYYGDNPSVFRRIMSIIKGVFSSEDDDYFHFDKDAYGSNDYSSYSTRSRCLSNDCNASDTNYGVASTYSSRSHKDKQEDYYERLQNNNSLTDDRGYMRDGKAEELMYQLEKAKRLGRLTDDRGFIIDEDYVLNRYYHYDPDEDWEENRDEDD